MASLHCCLLVGVDDSPGAVAAVRWAERHLAARREDGTDCSALLLAAWSRPVIDTHAIIDDAPTQQEADDVLDDLTRAVADPASFETLARRGKAADVILAEAAKHNVDLIIVGSRGRGPVAQVLLGSVSRSVAARSETPVAIIPTPSKRPANERVGPGVTVVGFDDSDGSRAALRWALDNTTGEIVAVAAWTLPNAALYDPARIDAEPVREAAQQQLTAGLAAVCGGNIDHRITQALTHGDPRHVILDTSLRPTSIVIGARANHGLKGLLLGSIVTYVACHSPVPVIVVPPSSDGR